MEQKRLDETAPISFPSGIPDGTLLADWFEGRGREDIRDTVANLSRTNRGRRLVVDKYSDGPQDVEVTLFFSGEKTSLESTVEVKGLDFTVYYTNQAHPFNYIDDLLVDSEDERNVLSWDFKTVTRSRSRCNPILSSRSAASESREFSLRERRRPPGTFCGVPPSSSQVDGVAGGCELLGHQEIRPAGPKDETSQSTLRATTFSDTSHFTLSSRNTVWLR